MRMTTLDNLFENNRKWAEEIRASDPDFFVKLAEQQSPKYLWIGCSDSRVPANQIVGLLPGELFVHRNIGNLAVHTDFNYLAVTQFAVEILKVQHVIVCGHFGCSAIEVALRDERIGLSDNWLRHIHDIRSKHWKSVPGLDADKLCELNVIEQVVNVSQTTIVREAWDRGQSLTIHGWIYRLEDGRLHDLKATISSATDIEGAYNSALERHQ